MRAHVRVRVRANGVDRALRVRARVQWQGGSTVANAGH
jgi:hypothetical protein